MHFKLSTIKGGQAFVCQARGNRTKQPLSLFINHNQYILANASMQLVHFMDGDSPLLLMLNTFKCICI